MPRKTSTRFGSESTYLRQTTISGSSMENSNWLYDKNILGYGESISQKRFASHLRELTLHNSAEFTPAELLTAVAT